MLRINLLTPLLLAVCLASPTLAERTSEAYLARKMDQAFRARGHKEGEVKVVVDTGNGRSHGFNVRPIGNYKRRGDTITLNGLFFHRHTGRDDRVYYSIYIEKGKRPQSKVTKIQYMGFTNSKILDFGKLIPGEVGTAIEVGKGPAGKLERLIRSKREGNWEEAAQIVVKAIAIRLAKELK